jgi:hypothetical protein
MSHKVKTKGKKENHLIFILPVVVGVSITFEGSLGSDIWRRGW